MQVKGSAFLARKHQILKTRGEPAWDSFVARLAKAHPFFSKPILSSTSIPVDTFLRFQELLVREFFDNRDDAYWGMGAAAAEWALTEGPYRAFIASKDVRAFVHAFPALWRAYFTTSDCEMSYSSSGVVEVQARALPLWHPYFEYLVMGYFRRALEMLGARTVEVERLAGGPNVPDFRYRFTIGK